MFMVEGVYFSFNLVPCEPHMKENIKNFLLRIYSFTYLFYKLYQFCICYDLFRVKELKNTLFLEQFYYLQSVAFEAYYCAIITMRNGSCGKVLFSQAYVSHSIHGEGWIWYLCFQVPS